MCSGVAVGEAGIGAGLYGSAAIPCGPVVEEILQANQPDGVPPLPLTGERTLPDVPAENYWYRRHLAVYEWIGTRISRPAGRRHGLRGGIRVRPARRGGGRRASSASTPTRRPTSTPGCATDAPTCASPATWSKTSPSPATPSSSCRRSSTSQDPGAVLEHFKSMIGAGRRRLRLHPEPADAGATEGAEKSDNPWHIKEYRAAEFRGALRGALRPGRAARPHPRAQAAGPRLGAEAGLGRGPSTARPDQALLRPLHPGDRRLRLRPRAGRPRPRARLPCRLPALAARERRAIWRSSSTRTCLTSRASAPTRSARSGCSTRWSAPTCRCSRWRAT